MCRCPANSRFLTGKERRFGMTIEWGSKRATPGGGSVLIWILALAYFLLLSVQVVEIVTKDGFLGVGIAQRDAKLRLPLLSKPIIVFQNPEVVQKELLVFDEIVLRKQHLLALSLEWSGTFRRIIGSDGFSIAPLGSHRLRGGGM